ncbi:MFS transporter [Kitasatospora sp. NPDC006697]|uniref:MFS transporter n=1 Tax=Kitasatospora sp. NPDC006697 TaxID=3364020 RepID=UPI0036A5ABA6
MTPGPFQSAAFRWFFAGRLVSMLGSSMAPVALAFAVLQYARSAGDLGIVLAARSVPMLVFLLLGGAVADRIKRSTVLVVSNLGAALTQGGAAALLVTHHYQLGTMAALQFGNGMLAAFTNPALRGIVPQLVGAEQRQRANAALGSTKNAISIFGPTVAGIAVATVGGGWAIAADAASYALAALCLARLRVPELPASGGRAGLPAQLREGWAEFRARTWVFASVAAFAVSNCFYVGIWVTLGPALAKGTIGATGWGLVLSARAAGLLVMNLLMYRITIRRFLMAGQLGYAFFAVPMIMLGLHAGTAPLAAAAFLAGLGTGLLAVAWDTTVQEHVPNEVLSRVSSYDDLGSYLAVPVGQVAAGPAAALVGGPEVAVVGGVLFGAAVLSPLLSRSTRTLEHPVPAG